VVGGNLDFTTRKSVSGHVLDTTFTELVRDDSDSPPCPCRFDRR